MDDFWLIKIVNFLLSSLFLLGAWCSRKIVGVWLNPASIFLLFWFFYTAFPLVVAFEAPVSPWSIAYILSFCFAFSLSSFLFRWPVAFELNQNKPAAKYYFDRPLIIAAFYTAASFALLMTFLGVLKQGISIAQILANPIAVGGIYAGKRYSGEIVNSIYSQLGLQCCYYTAVLGGLIYGSRDKSKIKIVILIFSFLPALLVMFMQSAKGLFFFSVFLFIGGILVARIYNKNLTLLNYANIRSLCWYGALVLPLILVSFLSRGIYQLNDASVIFDRLRYYLVTYSSVHLPAFSDWFSERYFDDSLMSYRQDIFTTGFYTFMSFFQLAGDDRFVPMGIYDEYYEYGAFIKGNLYTVFRGFITDFTLPGSLLFALVLGYVCNLGYWRLLCHRNSAFAVVFFIYFIAMAYQTYVISSLTWLTLPLVFLVQWFVVYFLMKVRT
ncbi:O-antigen polymerase [Serpens gallinarum]|uniref:Oligosaccharide repeat unit polymerase n=1 Tax=Serpens gallinarum TaxID=2763075 RepID=A0ABR8TS28_9PSED|nr:O-antigen polymerase [Serpens gallinarum]MBD7978573.1 oligosaccharide repeat unit polymerase [Serpens gallinarum]